MLRDSRALLRAFCDVSNLLRQVPISYFFKSILLADGSKCSGKDLLRYSEITVPFGGLFATSLTFYGGYRSACSGLDLLQYSKIVVFATSLTFYGGYRRGCSGLDLLQYSEIVVFATSLTFYGGYRRGCSGIDLLPCSEIVVPFCGLFATSLTFYGGYRTADNWFGVIERSNHEPAAEISLRRVNLPLRYQI